MMNRPLQNFSLMRYLDTFNFTTTRSTFDASQGMVQETFLPYLGDVPEMSLGFIVDSACTYNPAIQRVPLVGSVAGEVMTMQSTATCTSNHAQPRTSSVIVSVVNEGIETISVPAGQFQAFKYSTTIESRLPESSASTRFVETCWVMAQTAQAVRCETKVVDGSADVVQQRVLGTRELVAFKLDGGRSVLGPVERALEGMWSFNGCVALSPQGLPFCGEDSGRPIGDVRLAWNVSRQEADGTYSYWTIPPRSSPSPTIFQTQPYISGVRWDNPLGGGGRGWTLRRL
jgi:hypothetical protein